MQQWLAFRQRTSFQAEKLNPGLAAAIKTNAGCRR